MIWVSTFLFFFGSSAIIFVGFHLYAKALISLHRANKIVKHIASIILYVIFSLVLICPILFCLATFPEWKEEFNANYIYMLFLLSCYGVALVPGMFKCRYLESLRYMGYFNKSGNKF